MKLYEISQELRGLLEADSEAYTDTIEGLQLEFEEKADSIGCYIKELQAQAEAIKAEERSLAERRKAKENKLESLKAYLYNEMQVAGVKKVETARNVLSIRKTPAKVVIQDEALFIQYCIDNGFKYMLEDKISIKKVEVKEALKDGMWLEGADLEAGESFSIK